MDDSMRYGHNKRVYVEGRGLVDPTCFLLEKDTSVKLEKGATIGSQIACLNKFVSLLSIEVAHPAAINSRIMSRIQCFLGIGIQVLDDCLLGVKSGTLSSFYTIRFRKIKT
jgi:hypothetical protein